MVQAVSDAFTDVSRQDEIRAVVLTGNGRSFCAGADLSSMRAAAEFTYEENLADAEGIVNLMAAVNECPHPVVGRINGSATGGGVGLVSCCDIAVAVERAKFAFSEVRLGLVPAVISPFILEKIGKSTARELFLTGERFDAQRAKDIGLIQKIVPEEDLDDAVRKRISQLLQAAPDAARIAKMLIREVTKLSESDARSYAVKVIADVRASQEGREGTTAFLEKREPWWRQ
jgi:methylglutaconyl-CoA hydratase